MPNSQCYAVTPRIARMLRELEGPPEEFAEVAKPRSGREMAGWRSASGYGRRVLASVLVMAGVTIVMAMVAVQARAPADNDRHVSSGSRVAAQHLTAAGRVSP